MDTDPACLLPIVYERREDHHATRAEVTAQECNVAAAQGVHWPQISLRGAYGVRAEVARTRRDPIHLRHFGPRDGYRPNFWDRRRHYTGDDRET